MSRAWCGVRPRLTCTCAAGRRAGDDGGIVMNGWARAAAAAVAVGAVACVEVGPRTGLDGQVRQRPCGRPIVEGEPVCEDLPVEAGIVVTDGAGVERARTRTD